MAIVRINGFRFDPVAMPQELEAVGWRSVDAHASNYLLAQTRSWLTDEDKDQLAGAGVFLHEYIEENTYLCQYPHSDLDTVRALPFVVWADVYFPGLKLLPSLRSRPAEEGRELLLMGLPTSDSSQAREVLVLFHEDVDPSSAELGERIAGVAGEPARQRLSRYRAVRMSVPEHRLSDLAMIDVVRSIEEYRQPVLFNDVARTIIGATVKINSRTYRGHGKAVAIADTGFDEGSTNDVHPAFTGRVSRLYARARLDDPSDPHGHGTHVAGSVLGRYVSGNLRVEGAAPEAELVVQSIGDANGSLTGIPDDLKELFDQVSTDEAAYIHSNSWGDGGDQVPYTTWARNVDEYAWMGAGWVILFAAGNAGDDWDRTGVVDMQQITGPAAAKNCITVGASESQRNLDITYGARYGARFPVEPLHGDRVADAPQGMAAFSSRGPTFEGRIKPDVVAPGTCILSARSRRGHTWEEDGVSPDTNLNYASGTSMATPLTAGCIAVIDEALGDRWTPAELLKALLINGASDLIGQYSPSETGTAPNSVCGFGRVSLRRAVLVPDVTPEAGFYVAIDPLSQGQTYERNDFNVPHSLPAGSVLKVTLVWTDPPGAALQNDLDLEVVAATNQSQHGNMGTSSGWDRSNNVEQVTWVDPPAGKTVFKVHCRRITRYEQHFALVWRIFRPAARGDDDTDEWSGVTEVVHQDVQAAGAGGAANAAGTR